MKSKVLGKVVLLVLAAVVVAVLVEYFVFTGDVGEVIKQYMELGSAGNVMSSKEIFKNYEYQVVEQVEAEQVVDKGAGSVRGQALADVAYNEYQLYQQEKEKHNGNNFGSWVYADWYAKRVYLNNKGVTYDSISDREDYTVGSEAWCAMFYSCVVQAVQRSNTGALLYGARCEELYARYCSSGAELVLFADSYLVEHLKRKGKTEEQLYEYVALQCSGLSSDVVRNSVEFVDGGSYVPFPGDLVFFHWNTDSVEGSRWITHIGIVYEYDTQTGYATVVEGNRNGNHNATRSEVACVVYKDNAEHWSQDKKNFIGYVRPAY